MRLSHGHGRHAHSDTRGSVGGGRESVGCFEVCNGVVTCATTGPQWKPARMRTQPRDGSVGSMGVSAAARRQPSAKRAMRAAWSVDCPGNDTVTAPVNLVVVVL